MKEIIGWMKLPKKSGYEMTTQVSDLRVVPRDTRF